ncbi:MAG TPA: RNA 2',3'-cyclic phosphodiesterase [Phycisphaerae bacterium]|nr:RNA 2',3'-cyclic phosphodiesterase [Phycisphaerae bacterium]
MRTFIAVEFDEPIRRQLATLQSRLKAKLPKLKWVEVHQIHLTLKFLGEISDQQITPIAQALTELAAKCWPLEIRVEDLGCFPPSGPVSVVWVGIKDPSGELAKCQALCEDLIEPFGFPRERRRFSPHLTLARTRDRAGGGAEIRAVLKAEPPARLGTQAVSGVTFFQSTLTPRGPIYNALSKHPFAV